MQEVSLSSATHPAGADSGGAKRAIRVMLVFATAEAPLSAEDVSARSGVPLSSVYRYLGLLRDAGLVEEDGQSRFNAGAMAIGLARAARAAVNLVDVARPHLQALTAQTGETCILLKRSAGSAVCIDRVESPQQIRFTFEIGTIQPLHRGAGPRILDAYDPAEGEVTQAWQRKRATIHKRGWSESEAEITPHVWAVAAPVFTGAKVVAALSLVTPSFRIGAGQRPGLREAVIQAAARLSAELGRKSP